MSLFTLDELESAAKTVRAFVPPTPAYAWPLLAAATGAYVVVKHENHTPTGSFKARGGLVYVEELLRSDAKPAGLVTATRGNHGQSIALAATKNGLPVIIVVPEGNSPEKNAAMAAFGGEIVTGGKDFDESRGIAAAIQRERGYHFVRSFHRALVKGVATYAYELFAAYADLDAVYVPIGMGSGICGLITVRDLLGLKTEIIGVVADNAPAFALSFEAGHPVRTNSAATFADGVATRDPPAEALEIIRKGASRVVRVREDEIAGAVCLYFTTTHNLAEGAGAAPLAALMKEKDRMAGKRVGLILTGGNIDRPVMEKILRGETPKV
jgi:threonine dehydratase